MTYCQHGVMQVTKITEQVRESSPSGWHKPDPGWLKSRSRGGSLMPRVPERLADQPRAPGDEEEEEEGAGKGVERVGREQRRGVLPASPLASLSLDTPFSGSPTPGGGPWFPFSPHRDTDKVTHPEKGQSVGRSVVRSSRNSCPV